MNAGSLPSSAHSADIRNTLHFPIRAFFTNQTKFYYSYITKPNQILLSIEHQTKLNFIIYTTPNQTKFYYSYNTKPNQILLFIEHQTKPNFIIYRTPNQTKFSYL